MRNKNLFMVSFLVAFALLIAGSITATKAMSDSEAAKLEVSFLDSSWDGKFVPVGQQCEKFDGDNPATPRLLVKRIPAAANVIIMEFSDRSYMPMDDGGHGKIGYRIAEGTAEVSIPSVPGHTFKLPEGFFTVTEHQAPDFDTEGAYLPPCSGGRGNFYYVTIKAAYQASEKKKKFKVLGQAVLELGRY